jgi:hypothetical protein
MEQPRCTLDPRGCRGCCRWAAMFSHTPEELSEQAKWSPVTCFTVNARAIYQD